MIELLTSTEACSRLPAKEKTTRRSRRTPEKPCSRQRLLWRETAEGAKAESILAIQLINAEGFIWESKLLSLFFKIIFINLAL